MKRQLAMIMVASALYAGMMTNANAISAGYRAQLEREHKTQVQDATPRQVAGQKTFTVAREVDTVMNAPISEAADYLLSKGWKPNNGQWTKGAYILRLVVENEKVVNAQLTK